ncbi:MAG TPA: VWA domain-containing protein [Blastocatellia bacterium]
MAHRSLMIAAMSVIGLTAWATLSSSVISAQDKAGQPISVFVAALKGECGPARMFWFDNGQGLVGPPISTPYNTPNIGKTILTRFDADPISRKSAEDEFRKNKIFRVVDSPMQADFVFCLCARYFQLKVSAEIRKSRNLPEIVRIGSQAGAVSVERYLNSPMDPKALNEAAFWKTDDQGSELRDDQTANENDENDKKRKEKKDNQANGSLMVNGRPVERKPPVLPNDLAKLFIKRWPAFAATVAAQPRPQSNSQLGVAGDKGAPRPKITSDAETADEVKLAPETAPADSSTLRIETTLVLVPVMAMDRYGKYVPGLTAPDFQVYEDNVKQEISDFGSAETPIHVALILDVSGSTRFKLEDIQDAAMAFVDQLRPQDRVMVVSFDQEVRVDAEFTNERDKLMRAIMRTRTGGGTRAHDAIDLTLTERLDKIQGRKTIVIFNDGVDTGSQFATWQSVAERLEESSVIFYPVRYNTQWDMRSLIPQSSATQNTPRDVIEKGIKEATERMRKEYEHAAQNLKNLAEVSGGRYYEVDTIGDTNQAFANIAEELRRCYWLGYYPPNTDHDGKYRRIGVTVSKPGTFLRARRGYRTPEDDKAKRK